MSRTSLYLFLIAALSIPGLALAQPDAPPRDADTAPGDVRENREHREGRGDRFPREGREGRDRPGARDHERGDRRREMPDRRGDRDHQPLPVEQVDEAIATIREMHPESPMIRRIANLAKDNPELAAKHLGRYPRIREMIDTRANRPKVFKLHVQQSKQMREAFPLMQQIRRAKREGNDQVVAALRPKLRAVFEKIFDTRVAIERERIKRMKQELAEAEQELVKLDERRDAEIDRRMQDMLDRERGDQRPGPGPRDGDPTRQQRPRQRPDAEDEDPKPNA